MINAPGRMIRKDISDSEKIAKLSPEALNLFCLLIPHLNSYGKMNGGAGYIKDEVCPKIKYLTQQNIPAIMREISRKTNVKYFKINGRRWIHAIKFLSDHQNLRKKRLGLDSLPSYSGTSPGLLRDKSWTTPGGLPPEVEVEGKEEVEGKSKGNGERETTPNPMRGGLRGLLQTATKPMPKSTPDSRRAALKALREWKGNGGGIATLAAKETHKT